MKELHCVILADEAPAVLYTTGLCGPSMLERALALASGFKSATVVGDVPGDQSEVPDGDLVYLHANMPFLCPDDLKNPKPGCHILPDGERAYTVTTPAHLARARAILQRAINERLMDEGVILLDPAAAYIDERAVLKPGCVVYPNVHIEGNTRVEANAVLHPFCRIVDSVIGEGTTVAGSVLLSCEIGRGTTVGPFAYLRPGSKIGDGCRVGDFVEVKNATVGNGAKLPHLSYIGDGEVGERTNVGCGSIFVNYDGKRKHRTVVGSDCFIGCNTNLVAPVTVGNGAFIAAGSTITRDVKAGDMAIARARQVDKTGWKSPKER